MINHKLDKKHICCSLFSISLQSPQRISVHRFTQAVRQRHILLLNHKLFTFFFFYRFS